MAESKITLIKKEKGKLLLLGALAFVAVLLMTIGEQAFDSQRGKAEIAEEAGEPFQISAENSLADLLGSMKGVGEVKVNISWEGDISKTYVFNESSSESASADGDTEMSSDRELVLDDSGAPVVAEAEYPRISGVLVAAEGAENDAVKMRLLDAVASYLNIGRNRIEITAMGN